MLFFEITFEYEDNLHKIVEIGFKEGLSMGFENMDKVLAK
jgi:hypothetical protein